MGKSDWEEKRRGVVREGQGARGIPSSTLCRATSTQLQEALLACTDGMALINVTVPPAPVLGDRGHFLISPIIVPVAEGSHRNGESLPDWV